MAFGSESEESEGISSVIFSPPSSTLGHEVDKNRSKSEAYWKSKDTQLKNEKKKYCCVVKGCSANFSRPWRLHAHLSLHYGKKPFTCNEKDCNKSYTSSSHLRRHTATAHEFQSTSTTYECEFSGCTAQFKTRQNAKKHFKRTHEGRTCKECGKIFTKRLQLNAHQYEHTGVHPFKCKSCNSGFQKLGELRKHEKVHIDHFCPEKNCFLAFKSWSEVRKHLITHPRNYVCILCRKSYLCRKKLKEHILKHSDPKYKVKRKNLLKNIQCHICSASLVGKASLKRHLSVLHEGKRGQGKDLNEHPKKRNLRKDKGSVKKAMAPILANIKVPSSIDKKLLQRSSEDLTNEESVETFMQEMTTLQTSMNNSNSDVSEDDATNVLSPINKQRNDSL